MPRETLEIHWNFNASTITPKSLIWCSKTLPNDQNEVQTGTWNHQIHEKSKKWNLMKTLLFTILLIGWDIRNQQIFHSKIVENHVCNPNMFLVLQMTEYIKKWPKMVAKGVPKIYKKSLNIQSETFQGPSVCIRDPLDCKMVPKWRPRTSKRTQNGYLGTLKRARNETKSNNQIYNKQTCISHFLIDFNPVT